MELPTLLPPPAPKTFPPAALHSWKNLAQIFCVSGSESGNLELLQKAADILVAEPEGWSILLQKYLKQGESYPSARSKACAEYTREPELSELLSSPNNILAVEYLKALRRRNSSMTAVTIRREGAGYHDTAPAPACRNSDSRLFFASASALRKQILEQQSRICTDGPLPAVITDQMPPAVLDALLTEDALTAPLFADDLTGLLNYRLLSAIQNRKISASFLTFLRNWPPGSKTGFAIYAFWRAHCPVKNKELHLHPHQPGPAAPDSRHDHRADCSGQSPGLRALRPHSRI